MSTKAMLTGVGVAGGAQLEKISAQIIRIRKCRITNLIKLRIHGKEKDRSSFYF
jgi:hypothetical protein